MIFSHLVNRYPSLPPEALAANLAEKAVTLAMEFELSATQQGWPKSEEAVGEDLGKQLFDYMEKHLGEKPADSPNQVASNEAASTDRDRERKQAIAWAASLNTSSAIDGELQKKLTNFLICESRPTRAMLVLAASINVVANHFPSRDAKKNLVNYLINELYTTSQPANPPEQNVPAHSSEQNVKTEKI